ncbi:MAG: TonB family protein [Steroidobacter sp.]
MTATTINTFPSLHHWSSPRSWALAIIVLLHAGFFWLLTHGISVSIPNVFKTAPPVYLPSDPQPTLPQPKPVIDVKIPITPDVIHVPPTPIDFGSDEPNNAPVIVAPLPTTPGSFVGPGDVSPPEPVVVEPRIDTRSLLSEPYYPPQEIRLGHEGTVLLSLYVLANGRVGEVKLERSSGYTRLDDSAIREAKRWRFLPGTRDGAPFAMWKQMPVTFRLNQ